MRLKPASHFIVALYPERKVRRKKMDFETPGRQQPFAKNNAFRKPARWPDTNPPPQMA
jgi:hypothetical protein